MTTDPLRTFVRLVNEGAYWESHEVLEGPWRDGGSEFYHGLILYASAFVHAERENAHGVRAQLRKALNALEPFPDAYLGIDVAGVRRHARKVLETVEEREDDPIDGRWSAWQAPRLSLDPERVRGSEPELAAG